MTKLQEIEKGILEGKKLRMDWLSPSLHEEQREIVLDMLETKRRFALDRRESWMPRTILHLIVPIVLIIFTAILTLWLTK